MIDSTEQQKWQQAAQRQAERLRKDIWEALGLDRDAATSDERVAVSHLVWELDTIDQAALISLIQQARNQEGR